ncbi:MAG: type II secretion system protein GspI [Proteobacteria bacterium]|nr:type II secretion system protein GspI [Pseudomonadota bacterium]
MRCRGFTLLEVLIAVAIASIALVTVAATVASSHRTTGDLSVRMAADVLARNLLDRYLIPLSISMKPDLKTEGGQEDMGGYHFTYAQTVDKTDTPGLFKLTVTVYDAEGKKQYRQLSVYVNQSQ